MSKKKEKKYTYISYEVPRIIIYLLWIVTYIVFGVALFFYSKEHQVFSRSYNMTKGILEIIWNELANAVTIVSGFMSALLTLLPCKKIEKGIKIFGAVSLFLLFNLCKCAYALELISIQFILIFWAFYIISLVMFSLMLEKSNGWINIDNTKLNSVLGRIRNQNILGIQLFEVKEITENEYCKYLFKYIDAQCRDECDINGMLTVTYKLKKEHVSEMMLVLLGYQKLIESGDEIEKQTLLASIARYKGNLLSELRQIKKVEEVNKEHCCIARMVILYLTLENMLQNVNSAGILALDGALGLESIEIERRLFTYFRTGILGTIFLGQNDIYTFDYWKDGSKTGRKYCAFQIDKNNKMLICMVILKERKDNLLSKDIVDAIKKIEKKLNDRWEGKKEISIC